MFAKSRHPIPRSNAKQRQRLIIQKVKVNFTKLWCNFWVLLQNEPPASPLSLSLRECCSLSQFPPDSSIDFGASAAKTCCLLPMLPRRGLWRLISVARQATLMVDAGKKPLGIRPPVRSFRLTLLSIDVVAPGLGLGWRGSGETGVLTAKFNGSQP